MSNFEAYYYKYNYNIFDVSDYQISSNYMGGSRTCKRGWCPVSRKRRSVVGCLLIPISQITRTYALTHARTSARPHVRMGTLVRPHLLQSLIFCMAWRPLRKVASCDRILIRGEPLYIVSYSKLCIRNNIIIIIIYKILLFLPNPRETHARQRTKTKGDKQFIIDKQFQL